MPFHPLASQRRSGPAAQAKSRTLGAVKRQVLVPAVGRRPLAIASAFVMTATAALDRRARSRRERCRAVHTATGFDTLPVAATTNPAGSVRVTLKSPYSR